jgi:hypothetical protein
MLRKLIKHGLQKFIRQKVSRMEYIRHLSRDLSPQSVVLLDYPINAKPRWDVLTPHAELQKIMDGGRSRYKVILESFAQFIPFLVNIKRFRDESFPLDPFWMNGWLPGLDGVVLYSMLSQGKPEKYIEIGSGNSTMFVFKAKRDNALGTKIISIDPHPRVEIDKICDEVVRKPLEDIDLSLFDQLCEGDILYVDNSHRAFMNSDAVVFFLDIVPRLKKGVIVGIHDIYLPYDYPYSWASGWYSEQYLLASYLLAKGSRFDILLPCMFVSNDNELNGILKPLWESTQMQGVDPQGSSFWIRMN